MAHPSKASKPCRGSRKALGITSEDEDVVADFLAASITPEEAAGPCPVGPGCIARVAFFQRRYELGLPLWHEGDAGLIADERDFSRPVFVGERLGRTAEQPTRSGVQEGRVFHGRSIFS